MSSTPALVAEFVAVAAVSLGASALFVVRLERVGARLGLSEAILGLLAALGADSPEITSAVTAIAHHQHDVATGVVLGSNIFNLAALLGLGAISAGRIALHRRVVILAGFPAMLVVVMTVGFEHRVVGVWPMALVLFGLTVPYIVLSEAPTRFVRFFRLPSKFADLLLESVDEEERDLASAIAPAKGTSSDSAAAVGSLVVVVLASVVMERIATSVGERGHWSSFILGGVVLAGVTSLPNAVAAIYLARRDRGAAALSTAMHSNMFNVIAGLVIPSLLIGVGAPTREGALLALWYFAITSVTLFIAYWRRGIGRATGSVIIVMYLVCLFNVIHR